MNLTETQFNRYVVKIICVIAVTKLQKTGTLGEKAVKEHCICPICRNGKLKILPPNFKCADVICDFCGFLAQVKARNVQKSGEKNR